MTPPFDLLPLLLRGAGAAAVITLVAGPAALIVGLIVGLGRVSPWRPVRFVARTYVEIFRGTSLLVQVFYLYYVLPFAGIVLPAILTGIVALALNSGAYASEVVRGSIESVDRGQHEVAIALDMPAGLTMRRVILPQAIPAMLPPFGNLWIELLKGTSLLSLITVFDLTFAGRVLFQQTGRATEIFAMVMVIYLLMAIPLTLTTRVASRVSGRGLHRGRSSA